MQSWRVHLTDETSVYTHDLFVRGRTHEEAWREALLVLGLDESKCKGTVTPA